MTRVSIVISMGIPAARDGVLGVHAEVCVSIRVLNAPITVNGVLDRRVRPTVVVVIRRVVAVMVVVCVASLQIPSIAGYVAMGTSARWVREGRRH